MLDIELKYNDLYYVDYKLGSYTIDDLSGKLDEILGEDWGYIASTITESVTLEGRLFDLSAWESEIAAPYVIDDVADDIGKIR